MDSTRSLIDPFMPKIEEWVDRSQRTVRADKLTNASSYWVHRGRADDAAGGRAGEGNSGGPATVVLTGRGWPSPVSGCGSTGEMGPESAWSGRWKRARDAVVPRMAGVVPLPGGDPGLGPDPAHGDLVHRLHFAGDRRGTDLSTHRQREDDDHRPGHRDRGPSSSSRGRRTPLRPASARLRPVRSRVHMGAARPPSVSRRRT